MKHILIPLVKFIWAVILTFFVFIINIVWAILDTLWELKPTKGMAFDTIEISYYDDDTILSPYVTATKRGCNSIYFKTYFHYIWGIENKKH